MHIGEITAAAAGEWTLGDLTVRRMGYGSMRITADPARLEQNVAAGALRLSPAELRALS